MRFLHFDSKGADANLNLLVDKRYCTFLACCRGGERWPHWDPMGEDAGRHRVAEGSSAQLLMGVEAARRFPADDVVALQP